VSEELFSVVKSLVPFELWPLVSDDPNKPVKAMPKYRPACHIRIVYLLLM